MSNNKKTTKECFSTFSLDKQMQIAYEICKRAAKGDLEARIIGADSDTDFGKLCLEINRMLDLSDSFVRESAAAMNTCSQGEFHRPILLRGLHGAYTASAKAINLAGLALKDNDGKLRQVGMLASHTAKNVSTVASACEELNATSREIALQAENSKDFATRAVETITTTKSAVSTLNNATHKIGNVISLIRKIASKTNLLALNANIEAARVGELGAGFGVVANEVKELSSNTSQATEEINLQVTMLQATAHEVAEAVNSVSELLDKASEGASFIASSVNEQASAVSEIAQSISEISRNSEEISNGISSSDN